MKKDAQTVPSQPRPEALTILICADGFSASKKFIGDEKGGMQKIDYNAGMYFGVIARPVSDIRTLSAVLLALEGMPDAFAIRGALINPPAPETRIQRLKVNFATPAGGRRWVLIDFDKIQLSDGLDLSKDTHAVIEHLVSLLPSEFHDCSYHYQLSSSAGMGSTDKVSAHVWFWLTEPWSDEKLKAWAKAFNERAGYMSARIQNYSDVRVEGLPRDVSRL